MHKETARKILRSFSARCCCVTHALHSLRTGGPAEGRIGRDVDRGGDARGIAESPRLTRRTIKKPDDNQQESPAHGGHQRTATPIKHVIVLREPHVDNVYATYAEARATRLEPARMIRMLILPGLTHWRRSSRSARSARCRIIAPTVDGANKTAYARFAGSRQRAAGGGDARPILKDPEVSPAPSAHVFSAAHPPASPVIVPSDLPLLTSGATGLANCTTDPTEPPSPCATPDTRVANYNALPNTVFQITGRKLPYDSYSGDMVHRFYHMWQQSDCDVSNATPGNPSGCLNDLYPFVGIARGDDSGSNSMGFYNVQKGDAPVFKRLADEYTMRDNYHQPVMGGTAVQHTMLMTGDQIFWESSGTIPAQPRLLDRRSDAEERDERRVHARPALDEVRRSTPAWRAADHAVSAIPALAARPDCIELRAGALLHGEQHTAGIPVERSCQHGGHHRGHRRSTVHAADDRRRAQRAPHHVGVLRRRL
jgi:hypothetical protein